MNEYFCVQFLSFFSLKSKILMNAIFARFRSNAASSTLSSTAISSSSSSSSDSPTPTTTAAGSGTLHVKKRKLEATTTEQSAKVGVGKGKVQQLHQSKKNFQTHQKKEETMLEAAGVGGGKEDDGDGVGTAAKRRRKTLRCGGDSADEPDTKTSEADSSNAQRTPVLLPQKKRVLPSGSCSNAGTSPVRSPARKSAKAITSSSTTSSASATEDAVDDETLIRETEAALKSLSGSWPGSRGSFYNRGITEHEDRFESPTFENLFEEKKANNKMSPSSSSSSSSGCSESSSCSLKDVITLRGQQSDSRSPRIATDGKTPGGMATNTTGSSNQQMKQSDSSGKAPTSSTTKSNCKTKSHDRDTSQQPIAYQEGNELENLLKIENECATIQSQVGSSGPNAQQDMRKNGDNKGLKDRSTSVAVSSTEGTPSSSRGMEYTATARYEPDFNELVDDSSNELEIDMSDPSGDKEDDDDSDRSSKTEDKEKRKEQSTNIKNAVTTSSSEEHALSSFQDRQHAFGATSQQHRQFQANKPVCASTATAGTMLPTTATPSPLPSSTVSFSSSSAFRAINSSQSSKDSSLSPRLPVAPPSSIDLQGSVGGAIPPIGPFPASATFVGYPGSVGLQGHGPDSGGGHHHTVTSLDEKHTAAAVCLLQLKTNHKDNEDDKRQEVVGNEATSHSGTKAASVSVASPDASSSKQYTILQPAGAGSRAASAIQDVTREGVLSVAAVSSSSSSSSSTGSTAGVPVAPLHHQQAAPVATAGTSDPIGTSKIPPERGCSSELNRPAGPLSPSGLNRGEYHIVKKVRVLGVDNCFFFCKNCKQNCCDLFKCQILGFHRSDYEELNLLGYDAV
jgi:hypothetical protein